MPRPAFTIKVHVSSFGMAEEGIGARGQIHVSEPNVLRHGHFCGFVGAQTPYRAERHQAAENFPVALRGDP